MDFQDVVRRRRMVRRYDDRPVAAETVDRMLANAQRAPSAGFSQGWAFLVLDDPEDLARFWDSTTPSDPMLEEGPGVTPLVEEGPGVTPLVEEGRSPVTRPNPWLDGMRTAPVVIVPLASKAAYLDRYAEPDKGWTDRDEARWPVPYWFVDTGMASLLILQTAVDEGLGACFFGIPPEQIPSFREAFGVPGDFRPIGAITVGHRVPDTGAPGSPARRERRTNVVHRGRWSTTVTP